MNNNNKSILLALAAVLSWSTVATAFKVALTYLTHFEMLLVASVTSLAIFAIVLTVQRRWGVVMALPRKTWRYFALLGLLNPVAYYLVLFKSYDLLPAQIAQPVNYFWPIFLLVLLALFAKQRIPVKKYIGMFISLGGLILISLGGGQIGNLEISPLGLFLGLMSALLWASYWMVNNKNSHKADATVACFMSFLFGSIYPPVSVLPSLSRLMKDGIGEGYTRGDHSALANQLFASYAKVQDARALASVIGEDELSDIDKRYIEFGKQFETRFLAQRFDENRSMEQTLNLGWELLGCLPESELDRVDAELLKAHYKSR